MNVSGLAVRRRTVVLDETDHVPVFHNCKVTQSPVRQRLGRKADAIAGRMLDQATFGDIDRNDLGRALRLITKLRIPGAQLGRFVVVDPFAVR